MTSLLRLWSPFFFFLLLFGTTLGKWVGRGGGSGYGLRARYVCSYMACQVTASWTAKGYRIGVGQTICSIVRRGWNGDRDRDRNPSPMFPSTEARICTCMCQHRFPTSNPSATGVPSLFTTSPKTSAPPPPHPLPYDHSLQTDFHFVSFHLPSSLFPLKISSDSFCNFRIESSDASISP